MISLNLKPCQLTDLPLDLYIQIFSHLQPYDILQASQTCKALYSTSLERTVWLDALHRICVENTLFEPSFPMASMSIGELQRVAMGPHHWISRSSSKERNSANVLPHVAKRCLMSSTMDDIVTGHLQLLESLYLVPGGRYLFSFSHDWMVLWDLGYPYCSSKEPHVIATQPVFCHLHIVHSTPDGLGLRIFIPRPIQEDTALASFTVYEIYPESTSPQIKEIAHTLVPDLISFHHIQFYSLSYDRIIFLYGNVLTIWDYKANTWARWGVEGEYHQILVSKSTLTLIRPYGVSVWQIPPLLPESSLSTKPSLVSPAFELKYPEGQVYDESFQAPCDWYSGTTQPLYYDLTQTLLANPLKISRFEVTINSNISCADLNLRNTFEVPMEDDHYHFFEATRICQDKNVAVCVDDNGFLGSRVSDIYDQLPSFEIPLCYPCLGSPVNATLCPIAGRLVFYEVEEFPVTAIVILDF